MKIKNIALSGLSLLVLVALVNPVSAATINLNGNTSFPLGQSNAMISGTCTGSTLNVPIVLTQNNNSTQVAVATTPDLGPSENYVGFANFPLNVDEGFVTGAATLTAVCPEGNVSASITLVDPDPAPVNNTNNNNNPTPTNNTPTVDVGGTNESTGGTGGTATTNTTSDNTTPTGGVAAGLGGSSSNSSTSLWTILGIIIAGLGSIYYLRKTQTT